jgi:Ca2+-binding EF-hand superfamily protein
MLSKLGLCTDAKTVEAMMSEADGDGDGVISFEEFTRLLEGMDTPVAGQRKSSISSPVM